jgi:hypothetical protein
MPARNASLRSALMWLALAVAFSPVLIDLARNFEADASAHPTVLTPLLLAWCGWRGLGVRGRAGRDGLLWIALGTGLEVVGIAGGAWTLARLGLPIAVLGLARWLGRPSLALAALCFWIVPVPHFAFALTTPGLESFHLELAAGALAILGIEPEISGTIARAHGEALQVFGSDGGAPLVAALSQLGWVAGLHRGATAARRLAAALAGGLAAVAIQPLAIAIGLVILHYGDGPSARLWLDDGAWLTAAVGGLLYISRGAGRNEGTCR